MSALNDENALNELNVVKLFNNALKLKNEKNFIDFQQIINNLSFLTNTEKIALYYYIKNNLNIQYNKWKNISTNECSETDINVEIQNIIQQVYNLTKQVKKYNLINSNKVEKNHKKFINKSQNQYMKISLAVFSIFEHEHQCWELYYKLCQNEQIKRMIIKYQYKENVAYE